ncbi:MAG TPA: hypothetical protein VN256_12970 [Pyrinomonadaceae bacterium]|nr:hypothetical protein [Pyrinomonadaceae bacterium]
MSKEKEPPMLLNLSNINAKRQLIQHINLLSGLYEVSIKRRKRNRSLNQNSYYWAAFIPGWLEWLRREEGDSSITAEQAHIALKCAVLGSKVITNKSTGEAIDVPPTTRDMNTTEFNNYLESAAKFLAEFAGIVVLPPEAFYERAA